MTDRKVDFFVIGGGSGGVRAARIAAGHGASVMLAEEFRMGGTCVIRGCVPKKLLVYASRYGDEFEDAAGFGWRVPKPELDWPSLVAAKETEITRLESAYTRTQEHAGVTVVKSRAVLEDAHTVQIVGTGERVHADRILIATGGRPHVPDHPGIDLAITSNEAFDLPALPKHIVIMGAGYIAVEFAGIFAGLGSRVTLVHRGDTLLRGFDCDLQQGLYEAYQKRGIEFRLNDGIVGIEKAHPGLNARLRGGESLFADQVMVAVGRTPNTRDLGLEAAGVALDARGAVIVDDSSRTTIPHIFAVGDVTDRVPLTPVAIREGQAVADTVFGGKPSKVDYATIPTAVFSTPELGTVGLTEAEACARYDRVDLYRAHFRPLKATVSGRDERVMMKLLVDPASDKVLGAHILGEGAGEMAQLLGIILKMGATKSDFDATMALHPTSGEELVTMRTPTARFVKS